MTEPTSSSAAGFLTWKAFGGAAGAAGLGAGLATAVVMLMTPPRSPKEWAVGLICTVLGSICGGAMVIVKFDLLNSVALKSDADLLVAMVALLGLVFACGLPMWAIVRWTFTWIIKRQDKDLGEVIKEARDLKG